MLHVQVSVLHATSLSQVYQKIAHNETLLQIFENLSFSPQFVVLELLKRWGHEGFFNHVDNIEAFYQERRDAMVTAAEKHLTGNNKACNSLCDTY